MSSILDQGKQIWSRLPMSGRVMTLGAAVATIGLISAIIFYGSQSEYGVLFSDLKPADAQTIVEKLKASGVPYALANNGTTVQVPNERISELRLQMAGSGVLSGGHVGFDLFDKTSFGATDFAQQINYRRAIEGELAKTLEGMDEIEGVRVHMTPKRESVFTEKEEGAKASVMLRVRQGKELSSERTDAIVSLVASSIQGLDPSSVSVMDTRGRLLTSGRSKKGADASGVFDAQLASKRNFETATATRVIALLEPITGDGRVRADVSADVDFSKTEETEEKYNPQSQVIRSQKNTQAKSDVSTVNGSTAAVGARSNDPTTPLDSKNIKNQKTGKDERVSTTTNYEIDKTVRRTVGGGGKVNRLTVSVLVDHKVVNDTAVARTAEELSQIEKLVGAAVGIDEKRGDTIVVQTMPFNKEHLGVETPTASFLNDNKQLISTGIKYGLLAIVSILVLFFVIRPARKALKTAAAKAGTPQLAGALTEGDAERRLDGITATGVPALGSSTTVAELAAQLDQQQGVTNSAGVGGADGSLNQLNTVKKMLMDENPEESEVVVGTLRGWLHE